MPRPTADTGHSAAGEGRPVSLADLPDEVFSSTDRLIDTGPEPESSPDKDKGDEVDAVVPETEPEQEAEPEPEDTGEAEGETPSDEEASPEAKPPLDTSAFDGDAWAVATGVDRDLVKYCKTEREALDVVAKRLVHQQELMGRLSAEVGESRKRGATPPTSDADALATVAAMQALPADQKEKLQEWLEEDPVQANLWILQNFGGSILDTLVDRRLDARDQANAKVRERQTLLDEQGALFKAHPEARSPAVQAEMRQAYNDVGHEDFSYQDAYDLAQLKRADAAMARDIIDLMREGVSFGAAKRTAKAERAATAAEAEVKKATAHRAEDAANVASRAKRVPTGTGEGQHVSRTYRSIREMPDEYFTAPATDGP